MVLVTGGTGFVGSYLLHYLVQQGEQVRALRRPTSDLSLVQSIADRVDWVEADVLDVPAMEAAFDGVEDVYHCAALVSYKRTDVERLHQINVQGTANVVNLCIDHKVRKLLHVSSIGALPKIGNGALQNEQVRWENSKNNTTYGLTKWLSENEVWRGMAEGLDVVVVNPSVVLGAGALHSSSVKIFRQMREGFPFFTAGVTGFVDVRDVVKISYQLMQSDVKGERFILNAENLPLKEVLSKIAVGFGQKPPTIKVTPALARAGYYFEKLRAGLTNRTSMVEEEMLKTVGQQFYYDNSKIRKRLDYSFIPVEQTIAESVAAFMEAEKVRAPYAMLEF